MRHTNIQSLKAFFLLLAVAFGFASCEKDEDKIYLSSLEPSELTASTTSVVLTSDNAADIVLSLAWTKDALQLSDASLTATDLISQTLQACLLSDFSGTVNESSESSLSKAYTGAALNTLAKNIGATVDEANTVYFRLAATTGDNMDPTYSNTVSVSITPYAIDMSIGYILNTSQEETGATLYSPDEDGVYTGFMGATSWYNFYMMEGDGTIWGNDGVDGTAFLISSDTDTQWNFWFPGQNGCYYVIIDTPELLWSSLLMPSLTVSGDIEGDLTFDRSNVKWTLVFTADAAGSATIQIAGTGAQYDYDTGTDDDSAISTDVAFGGDADDLTFGSTAEDITVDIPAEGECTLTLDLSDPTCWTVTVTQGAEEEAAEVSEYLYLPGIDDGISGSWTFDNYLRLYDEDELGYAGVANINSLWGYQIAIEVDNWSDYYGTSDGTEYSGTLEYQGGNIPAPTGLYFMNVSLSSLTYALTEVTEVYYSGISDDWNLYAMTETDDPGVYTATFEVTGDTPWGFQIVLDQNWTTKFGGADGILLYQGSSSVSNIAFEPTSGTYTLTVDLISGTYTIEEGEGSSSSDDDDDDSSSVGEYVYLPGIDDGTSGSWTFDNYLRLYDESTLGYGGAANVNSLWGYQICTEVDNWTDYYGMSSGDAYSGTLAYQGSNITAPSAGLYYFNVSLTNLTYSVTEVTEVYYSGIGDDWSLTAMTATDDVGVYTATFDVTASTSWGFQIVLDQNWTTKLGGSDGDLLYMGGSVSNIAFSATSGTYTLTVDLIKGTYTLEGDGTEDSSGDDTSTVNEYVYLPGIDDGISGSWTFDNYLRLYDSDNLGYAGVANVSSLWGYQICTEVDNWTDYYGMSSGDAYSGTLSYQGSNVTAPSAGLYFFDVSLGNLTYAVTAVSEVYYAGFNDDWTLVAMTASSTVGVYTATITITGSTPWGYQIVLDTSWTHKLGGADGILLYEGSSSVSNISCDKEAGTYTLTVDLIKGTYSLE